MARDIIPSLAILQVNWDEGQDYVDNFVPFVAECLRHAPQPEISLEEVQTAVAGAFGIRIPQGALQTVLKRAVKYGMVERRHGVYARRDDVLAKLDGFSKTRADVLRKCEALVTKLGDFSSRRFKLDWSRGDAEGALLSHLETGPSAVLAAIVVGDELVQPATSIRGHEYVVASFILELQERDPEGFAFLEAVVKGSMLAGVLLFPEFAGVNRHFDEVEVFFDTAFVLQALGLEGDPRQAPRLELLRLLYEQNARLRIFRPTLSEVKSVLGAAAFSLRAGAQSKVAYYPTFQYFIDHGYSPSDVELVIARLEKKLTELRIEVVERPPYSKKLTVDEAKFAEVLRSCVGYARDETLQHDLEAVTAIHRLRKGEFFARMESCRAIFVSSNRLLSRAADRFFKSEYEEYRTDTVPYSMLDNLFTTLVWLKKPIGASDLPRKSMIADCYAVMNPPDELWKKYVVQSERLRNRGDISAEDYDLLRLSTAAHNALMEATLGEADAFAEGTVVEVLARAQAAARAETEAELGRERDARIAAEKAAEERVAIASAQAAEVVAAEKRAREAAESQLEAHRGRIRSLAAGVGRYTSFAVMGAMLGLVGLGTFLGLFLPDLPGGVLLPVSVAAVVAAVVAGLASTVFGANLNGLRRWGEVRTSQFVERALNKLFSADSSHTASS